MRVVGHDEFGDFFHAEFPLLTGFLCKTGFDLDPARDAAAEAMLNAYEDWRTITHPRSWVRRVGYRRAKEQTAARGDWAFADEAQEVCLAILRALPTYRERGRPFLAFVYGIAQHKVADARRAAARNRSEPVADVPDGVEDGLGPEQHALHNELSDRMGELLRILPDKQRERGTTEVPEGGSHASPAWEAVARGYAKDGPLEHASPLTTNAS